MSGHARSRKGRECIIIIIVTVSAVATTKRIYVLTRMLYIYTTVIYNDQHRAAVADHRARGFGSAGVCVCVDDDEESPGGEPPTTVVYQSPVK